MSQKSEYQLLNDNLIYFSTFFLTGISQVVRAQRAPAQVLSGRYLTCTKETIRFVVFFIFWNLQWTILLSELQAYHPGRRDGMTVSPTAQNSKIMAHKSFFRNNISFSNKMLRFFLKKTTPKFEGRWRKICDGPTSSTSNDISSTDKDCWQLDLPKTARSRCITPNHLHFPNKFLLICGNFSVHKNGKTFEYWS